MLRLLLSCFPFRKTGNKRNQENKVARSNQNPTENAEEVKVEIAIDKRNDDELSDMDKLSGDVGRNILMKILDYLDEQQLVKCRLLSSRWNEICCLLLQDKSKNKPDSKLVVRIHGNFCITAVTKPLGDFLKCFTPSPAEKSSDSGSGRRRPFPFSRVNFSGLVSLNLYQFQEFISTFGPHMKTVFLKINVEDSSSFETVWRLLLKFATNIQHLGLIGDMNLEYNYFSNTYFNAKSLNPNDTFLKNLKTFEVVSKCFGDFNLFVKNILDSAPNLEQVLTSNVSPFRNSNELKNLAVWKQLDRSHLLKKLEIKSTSNSYYSPADLMKNLQLEYLKADWDLENERETFGYIYHALKFSQNTLTSLNLNNLTMQGINRMCKDITSLPNVRQLEIQNKTSSENEIILERLSQLCPNVTNLNLGFIGGDFSKVARILWIRFKGLKSLKFSLDMTERENNLLAVDSVFSGYSAESIERIQSKLDEGISLEMARRGLQRNPSILYLKDLSRLELQFYMGRKTLEMEKMENQLWNSVFMKILPQHIRENPRSISYIYLKSIYY